jgi:Cft2 family RNA processing exonuclease
MDYNIISTGSHGNAVVLNSCILIDCGVSFKALKDVYKDIHLVLLTHIHSDHFKSKTLSILARERPTLRFACCEWLVNDLVKAGVNPSNIDILEIGKIYDYKAFKVSPIKLYHNVENCGYRLFFDEEKGLYATDTEHLNGIKAKKYDLYLIEANYTEEDLQERIDAKMGTGEYCYELNVANRHLSHEQASQFLLENMGENSKYVFLHEHIERIKRQGET